VEWFNLVDATYQLGLREINELNYQRFEAKLEQRLAELAAQLRTEFRTGLGDVRRELEQLRAELNVGLADQRTELRSGLASQRAELLRWMFLFWIGTVGPLLLAYLL
jgi:septal ring factor EnvC (AmiA/AmiB activator)